MEQKTSVEAAKQKSTHCGEANKILARLRSGDTGASSELWELLYDDLRARAHRALRDEPPGAVLQTTGIVHDAYLRLVDGTGLEYLDHQHFYRTAARVMKHILVDWARQEKAIKRGGALTQVPITESIPSARKEDLNLIDLNDALDELNTFHQRPAEIVELRFFAGLTVEETAKCLDVSKRTVEKDWEFARAWLGRKLRR